jgi:limonene-1,2-epoxide hydrolase
MTIPTTSVPLARRELLSMLGAGAALGALTGLPAQSAAAAASTGESHAQTGSDNVRIVKDFCAAWSTRDPDKVADFFAEDAVYRVTETAKPTVGRSAITQLLQRFLQRAQQVHFDIQRVYNVGPIVLTERHDHFRGPQGEQVFHVAGVFFVRDGKIAEWTDYIVRP